MRRRLMPVALAIDALIPAILSHVAAHKDQFLAEFAPGLEQWLARAAWWLFLRMLPRVIRTAYAFYVERFEHMEIGTFIDEIRRDLATVRAHPED